MIALIVAAARDGAIGRNGQLPWRLSTDLKRFKALTTGGVVTMGRKTWQSIGRPLPNRTNRVLTHDQTFHADGVHAVHSLRAGLREEGDDVWVIGGAQVYAAALRWDEEIHLSVVDCLVPDADTWLPSVGSGWRIAHRELVPAGPKDDHAHAYVVLRQDGVSPPFLGLDRCLLDDA